MLQGENKVNSWNISLLYNILKIINHIWQEKPGSGVTLLPYWMFLTIWDLDFTHILWTFVLFPYFQLVAFQIPFSPSFANLVFSLGLSKFPFSSHLISLLSDPVPPIRVFLFPSPPTLLLTPSLTSWVQMQAGLIQQGTRCLWAMTDALKHLWW